MSARAAQMLFALTAAMAIAGVALADGAPTLPIAVLEALSLGVIAAVGGLVALRAPFNPSGWLVGVIAASFTATIFADHLYKQTHAELAAWAGSWLWIPAMVATVAFAQLFPTGRPLTARWRPLLWLAVAGGPMLFVGTAFAAGPLEDYEIPNPLGAPAGLAPVVDAIGVAGFACLLVNVFGAFALLVLRWRRSAGVERQQLKWVATAAVLFPAAFAGPSVEVGGEEDLSFLLLLLALALVSIAVAMAILRYRLYDIDVVINRALVYTGLTVTLVAAYLVTVLVTQLVLPARSDLGVAVSTLAAAALVAPARRRIQGAVDRRFFRRRYDAERTLAGFGARLRDEVDLDVLRADLSDVVATTLQPAHVSLWIR